MTTPQPPDTAASSKHFLGTSSASFAGALCSLLLKAPRPFHETVNPAYMSKQPISSLIQQPKFACAAAAVVAPKLNEIIVLPPASDAVLPKIQKKKPTLSVTHLLACFNVGVYTTRLDLKQMAKNMQYVCPKQSFECMSNQRKFPSLMLTFAKPVIGKARVFNTGKVNVLGCKSDVAAKAIAVKTTKVVRKFYPEARPMNFRIPNMTGASTGPFPIRIDTTEFLWRMEINSNLVHVSYEPEFLPGIVLKFKIPSSSACGNAVAKHKKVVSCNLFWNGKFIITGVKNIEDMKKAEEFMFKKMRDYEQDIRDFRF